jgi:N-acetylglutamate synthase-like GNAT family acetyltransferase
MTAFQDIALRLMLGQDATELQRLSVEARDRYRNIPALEYVVDTPPVSAERFRSGRGWIATHRGEIVGYALVRSVDNLLFLDNISTSPSVRGSGIGSRLLEKVQQSAMTSQAEAVALTTFRSPPWNGPWFRRFGFISMPETVIGPELSAIIQKQAAYLDSRQRETLWAPHRKDSP